MTKVMPTPATFPCCLAGSAGLFSRTRDIEIKKRKRNQSALNLAPLLDVVTTYGNRGVIGDRAFGTTPEVVARCGTTYIEELQAGGILATAKHFPGHGATPTDSHHSLSVLGLSRSELLEARVSPFHATVDVRAAAVTTARRRLRRAIIHKYRDRTFQMTVGAFLD